MGVLLKVECGSKEINLISTISKKTSGCFYESSYSQVHPKLTLGSGATALGSVVLIHSLPLQTSIAHPRRRIFAGRTDFVQMQEILHGK